MGAPEDRTGGGGAGAGTAPAPARHVLVTGASRGIGRAIALRLARDGFSLALGYRTGRAAAEETLEAAEDVGATVRLLPFDVADRDAARAALDADLAAHGPYWGVVCNAGLTRDAPFPRLGPAAWDEVLRTNLDAFYNVVQPCVMPMVRARRGGRVVTLTSTAALTGNRGQVNYAASKAGLIGATKSLAQELAKRAITVNSVAPGFIETEMTAGIPLAELLQRIPIPMQRLGRPEEVAAAVSFLFSQEAGYITGQVISVNGGIV